MGGWLATGTNINGGIIEKEKSGYLPSPVERDLMRNFARSLPASIPAQIDYLSEKKSSRSTNWLPSNSVFAQLPFPLPFINKCSFFRGLTKRETVTQVFNHHYNRWGQIMLTRIDHLHALFSFLGAFLHAFQPPLVLVTSREVGSSWLSS